MSANKFERLSGVHIYYTRFCLENMHISDECFLINHLKMWQGWMQALNRPKYIQSGWNNIFSVMQPAAWLIATGHCSIAPRVIDSTSGYRMRFFPSSAIFLKRSFYFISSFLDLSISIDSGKKGQSGRNPPAIRPPAAD
jgi:hypothetical protein